MFAGISELEDVKCSGNWMWAGKTGVEGGSLVRACRAVCDAMGALGVAVDGGKDSLSMCAQVAGEKGLFKTLNSISEIINKESQCLVLL